MAKNFAITGVGGYIAPRHLRAIRDTGNRISVALDPNDSVGLLDQFSFDVSFFTEFERFDRHIEKLRRGDPIYDQVKKLSFELAHMGIDIVTGGGPGLMAIRSSVVPCAM